MSDAAVVTSGLTKCFARTAAVDRLDLTVPRGCVCGLVGRNGAGKTTVLRLLMGLIRRDGGQIAVLGADPGAHDPALFERLAFVPDRQWAYGWMRVRQALDFTAALHRRWDAGRAQAAARQFGLDPAQRVRQLSRGQGTQLCIAMALGQDPELLVLDEPATGLDVLVRRDVLQTIVEFVQDGERTVLLTSHLLHEVERVADHVGVIEGGRLIAAGTTEEMRNKVCRWVVAEAGPEPLAALPGVLDARGDGERCVVTVVDSLETRAAVEGTGARITETLALNLEDSFAEFVKPRGGGR